ncbi:NAD-dependent epimerase/dehydratase family protein [Streptomyces salinarius]|uniref:NAD-dependent epimerase/dehydratase family protein n=1 Tax=Streptomyces salinarius TaxID=2762598 RepID=UPI001969B69A|nr:NAD-dependent epimerase/dehydratase [Streptomyces salinarius]
MPNQGTERLITVLGASGLLGTAVSRELAGRPGRLRLVGRRPVTVPKRPTATVEERTVDLTEPGAVADAVAGSDVVIHLVAHSAGPGTWRVADGDTLAERVNLGLVHDVLDAVRAGATAPAPALLFAGSVSQAAGLDPARTDVEPPTAYDRHKLAAERAIAAATAQGLVRGSTLRLSTLYTTGTDEPALDRGVVATMTRRAFAGQPLTMWHGGTARRDLLSVDDAAHAFGVALDTLDTVGGAYWEIGTGRRTTVARLFTMIAETVARHTGRPAVPVEDTTPAEYAMPTDRLDFVATSTAFRDATGWQPRVALADGLDALAAAVAQRSDAHGSA